MLSMTVLVGTILALLVLTSLSRSSERPPRTLDPYLRSDRREPESVLGLREVCRSVLNTTSLRFVAANAPAEDREFLRNRATTLGPFVLTGCERRARSAVSPRWRFRRFFTNSPVPAVEAEGRTPLGCLRCRQGGARGITRVKHWNPTAAPDLGIGEDSDKRGKSTGRYGERLQTNLEGP